jgi:hypothetical protein
MLPLAIIIPTVLGWLRISGQRLGLFDMEIGVSVFTELTIIIFAALILFGAFSLESADRRRRQAEKHALKLIVSWSNT